MVDSMAIIGTNLYCRECDAEIYTCDGCIDNFHEGQYVCCHKEGHFHKICIPQPIEKVEMSPKELGESLKLK